MKNTLRSLNSTLAKRVLAYVILASTFVTLFTSSIQIYSEFRRETSDVYKELKQIEDTQLSNIISRLWILDTNELGTALNNLLSLPSIRYAAVYEDNKLLISAGVNIKKNIIEKEYSLSHEIKNKQHYLGQLIVKASLEEAYQHVIDRAIVILVSNTIKTFIVAFLILFIFYRLVSRHLSKISQFTQNPDSFTKNKTLTLDKDNTKTDELDFVASSINSMHKHIRKQLNEIQKQRQHLSQTLNSIGDAVITTDINGNITRINPVAEKLTGWASNEAFGKPLKLIFNIIDSSTKKEIENPIDKVISTGQTIYLSNHTTLISRHNQKYQISDSAAPILDDEKNILGMVLVFNDVSEQYKLREIASKSQRDLQAIMDNSPSIISLKNIQGDFIFINKSFEKNIAINYADILGKTAYDIYPKKIAEEMQINDKQVMSSGEILESEEFILHKNIMHIYSTIRFPLRNEAEDIYAICEISTDITEKRQADATVQKVAEAVSSETGDAFFQSLTRHLSKIFDAEYAFIGLINESNKNEVNTVAFSINGNIVDNINYDIENTPCKYIITNNCDAIKSYSSGVQAHFPDNQAMREMSIDSYIGAPLINHTGKPIGIIVVMDKKPMKNTQQVANILQILASRAVAEFERIQTEEALRRSQKMDALGKLTGGIAHDYNNMLSVVLGYADLLQQALDDNPKLSNYVKEISHAGQRSAKLTKKLLTFSRKKTNDETLTNINEHLLDEKHMLEKTLTARIELKLDLADDLWLTLLDISDLEDTVLNMSINAMHAITDNGQLTIKTCNRTIDPSNAVHLNIPTGDYVLLKIIDNGSGMDAQTREKLFDPFYTTKGDKGTGLGLSQVYGFIERSNGIIKVDSERGKGTQFKLYFPRQNKQQYSSKFNTVTENKTPPGKQQNILIVDDEIAILAMSTEILSEANYNILSANNAQQALKILETTSVKLVFSDIIMPEMDGYELAAIIQKKYPEIKILLTSGYNDAKNMQMIDSSLYENLLPKPYRSSVLLQKIHDLLN